MTNTQQFIFLFILVVLIYLGMSAERTNRVNKYLRISFHCRSIELYNAGLIVVIGFALLLFIAGVVFGIWWCCKRYDRSSQGHCKCRTLG